MLIVFCADGADDAALIFIHTPLGIVLASVRAPNPHSLRSTTDKTWSAPATDHVYPYHLASDLPGSFHSPS